MVNSQFSGFEVLKLTIPVFFSTPDNETMYPIPKVADFGSSRTSVIPVLEVVVMWFEGMHVVCCSRRRYVYDGMCDEACWELTGHVGIG
jgi:hypothetical protein